MSKPGKVLKGLCKKLGVRLTVKRGQKRVYKSVKVLKEQCANKKKVKKKKVKRKRRRKFGMGGVVSALHQQNALRAKERADEVMNISDLRKIIVRFTGEMNKNTTLEQTEKNIELIINNKNKNLSFERISLMGLMVNTEISESESTEWYQRLRNRRSTPTKWYQRPRDKELLKLKYFDNLNLKKANFSMSNMWKVSFKSSNLEQAKFVESTIYRSFFNDSNLKKADFTNASIESNTFSYCNMRKANFTDANMSSSNLENTDLRGANFTNAVLELAIFTNADLRGADLRGAVFEKVYNTFDSKPTFKHAIYDNYTRFPEGFNYKQHEIMHVGEWVKEIKSLYSAMDCIGGLNKDYITKEYMSRITHQIKLYEQKCNDKIEKFYKGNHNKFELEKYFGTLVFDLEGENLEIREEAVRRQSDEYANRGFFTRLSNREPTAIAKAAAAAGILGTAAVGRHLYNVHKKHKKMRKKFMHLIEV